jgi:hypothetical protein
MLHNSLAVHPFVLLVRQQLVRQIGDAPGAALARPAWAAEAFKSALCAAPIALLPRPVAWPGSLFIKMEDIGEVRRGANQTDPPNHGAILFTQMNESREFIHVDERGAR